jgi:5'-methylthioadenosine phosphorylase
MWGIIGGSGFEKFNGFEVLENLSRETPFGRTSSGIKKVRINGEHEALFVSRHGEHHEDLPTEVNYRANIFALKKYGARSILSFSAIGSLKKEYKPGDMVIPTQYIDRTKGVRKHTFLGDGLVGHVSLADPVCKTMSAKAYDLAANRSYQNKWDSHLGQTYVCIEGPYFSTRAESNYYRQIGADVIGMTHFPEFALIREAGLPYLPCCFVTDYDCWDESIPHVTLEEVIEVMRNNNAKAFEFAQAVLSHGEELRKDCECSQQGLKFAIFTPQDLIPADKREWLDVLVDHV